MHILVLTHILIIREKTKVTRNNAREVIENTGKHNDKKDDRKKERNRTEVQTETLRKYGEVGDGKNDNFGYHYRTSREVHGKCWRITRDETVDRGLL
jgi:hypothetical protein